MLFLKLGKIIAWLLLAFGTIKLAMGLYVALNFDSIELVQATKRYIGSGTTGEAIDQGIMLIVAGVFFGLIVKIASK